MSTRTGATRLASIASRIASLSGISPTDSPRTDLALQLIDVERVSSVPSLVHAFDQKRESISIDRNLSQHGKQEQIRAAANSVLGNIATLAKRLTDLESDYERDRATVPLPKPDAADMLLDLELARHIRASEPIPSRLVEMSERVRLAVARVPVELSGISVATQARVHGSLMSQQKAAQLSSEAHALEAARNVTQAAISELAPQANWLATELVRHFGTKWRLPGVTDSTALRLAAGDDSKGNE